jgi:hypothetical protein
MKDGGWLDEFKPGGNVPKPRGYIDITKQYGIPQFTEEYINKAMELNKQYPGSKFVCTANGCADIASQAATAMGHNFGKANAWEYGNRSDVLFTNPNYAKELDNPTGPLHDPTSYNVPKQFLGMENVLVGLNRKNNLLDVQGNKVGNIPNAQQVGAAKTRSEANDSLDYANQNLYKGSRGYEHVGYMMGNNTLLHGTGASKDHPAFFVLDDISNGIDLSGYGKYEPVEAIAEPTTMQTFTNKVRSLGTRTGEMIFGEPGSKQASSNIIKKENGGWLEKYNDGGPVQPNYNDYSVSAGSGFEGDGYSNVGRNYSPAWGGQFEDGGNLSFIKDPKLRNMLEGYQSGLMQPGDYRLPEGRMAGNIDPSTEVSISIGGEDGEPSYLIPSFKYGSPLQDPTQEFNMTGQYLGGPFKTWQDAEAYGELRHQYIDKGYKELPSPIATSNMAMGGSLPGATGFMYARVGAPSNGKYAKKTKASAENGAEMRYYQEGFDFNPKSISEDGSKNSKLTNQETIKKLGLKPVKTVNPIEQENLYATKDNFINGDGTLKDIYNFEKDLFKKGLEVIANPISALSALNRHGRFPRNFSKGEFSPFDLATSWFNPAARIESGINTYDSAKNVLSGKGGFGDYADLVLNASSLKNVGKAAGKEIKKIKETINFNKQQKLLPNRDAADWMKNMYSDPVIKQRIIDNTPDEFIKGLSNIIPDQFKARRTFWNDPIKNPIGNKNYNDLYKEKGFKAWKRHYQTSNGVSYGSPEEIYVKNKLFDKAEKESVRVHEATHAMEHNGLGLFKEEEEKLLKPFGLTRAEQYTLPPDYYGKKYYTDPTEIHARMNESRYKLGHTPGQKYTMDDFNKSMKMDNMDNMGGYIKDPKAFIELMNTFYQAAPVLGAGALGAAAIANQPEMEQGGQLTKLDQLTNFTNYNTKQPGGWLDKYQ